MRSFLAFSIVFIHGAAMASGGGHGEAAHEIPTVVFHQAINFTIFVLILFFVLRKKVVEFFKGRHASFQQALVKAEAAKAEAESHRQKIQESLSKLESNTNASIAQAKSEAEALRKKIIAEAEELSKNLQDEARRTAQYEIERARAELREELLSQSVITAKKVLSEKMAEPDQKRLQNEFVDKIQVVR